MFSLSVKPHWDDVHTQVMREKLGKPLTIVCNICANPQPTSYTWTFGLDELPDGVQNKGRTLVIEELEASHLGKYGCKTDNMDKDAKAFVITVEQIKSKISLH